MTNMLIEKRNELVATKEKLIADRKAYIDTQVEAYRIALEAQTPPADVAKINKVIEALDEVIAFDKPIVKDAEPVEVEVVQDVAIEDVQDEAPVEEAVEDKAVQDISVTPAEPVEARPGMSNIFTPIR